MDTHQLMDLMQLKMVNQIVKNKYMTDVMSTKLEILMELAEIQPTVHWNVMADKALLNQTSVFVSALILQQLLKSVMLIAKNQL